MVIMEDSIASLVAELIFEVRKTMNSIPVLSDDKIFSQIKAIQYPHLKDYYAFYSSWFGGIIKNPSLMLLPMDDHMVHRGDGVFEGMKTVGRSVYLIDEHLQRLFVSAKKIALEPPFSIDEIKEIILQTLKAADKSDATIRVYLSRGPGNFSVNPYDSVKAQLYVMVIKLDQPSVEKYEKGVKIGISSIPAKASWIVQVKSCNYLSNALMKKEAVDRHLDYVIGVDEENNVTEGSAENVIILDQNGVIAYPPLDNILKGTTMMRVCELAREQGISVEERLISCDDLKTAREILMTGTTIDILPVVKFEDQNVGDGKPGPVFKKLRELIRNDIGAVLKDSSY